jgi:hypothetical protein
MAGKIKWTYEMLLSVALEFETRHDFEKGNSGAYQSAQNRGLLDQVCQHMKPILTNWTSAMLQEAALKFKTRKEFKGENQNAYAVALRRGLLDRICQHMEPQHTKWSDEMLQDATIGFETRCDFKRGNRNAYEAARNRGLLDKICLHMKRGVTGFNPDEPGALYIVTLDSPVYSYIGFGISNYIDTRLKNHYSNANLYGYSLTILNVLDFKNGKDAADLERKLKINLPIVDTGVPGFRTEAILVSDYNKLEELINNH